MAYGLQTCQHELSSQAKPCWFKKPGTFVKGFMTNFDV